MAAARSVAVRTAAMWTWEGIDMELLILRRNEGRTCPRDLVQVEVDAIK
jgi:hypothetical protein